MSNSSTATIAQTEEGISFDGDLVFSTVASVLPDGCHYIEIHEAEIIIINLLKVKKIDSAGIAMLIAWKRLCDTKNKNFMIIGAQPQVVSLITANKLQEILQLR